MVGESGTDVDSLPRRVLPTISTLARWKAFILLSDMPLAVFVSFGNNQIITYCKVQMNETIIRFLCQSYILMLYLNLKICFPFDLLEMVNYHYFFPFLWKDLVFDNDIKHVLIARFYRFSAKTAASLFFCKTSWSRLINI